MVHEPHLHMLLTKSGKKVECFSKNVMNTEFSEINYVLKNTEKIGRLVKVTGSVFYSICSPSVKKKKLQTLNNCTEFSLED